MVTPRLTCYNREYLPHGIDGPEVAVSAMPTIVVATRRARTRQSKPITHFKLMLVNEVTKSVPVLSAQANHSRD